MPVDRPAARVAAGLPDVSVRDALDALHWTAHSPADNVTEYAATDLYNAVPDSRMYALTPVARRIRAGR